MKTTNLIQFLFVILVTTAGCEKYDIGEENEETPPTPLAAIGDYYEGGIVVSLDPFGQHGSVVSLYDLPDARWGFAVSSCENLVEGGYDDWVIPNSLQSIYDNRYDINQAIVINGGDPLKKSVYWCSSEAFNDHTLAYAFDFTWVKQSSGGILSSPLALHNKNEFYHVRAVRGF